LIGIDIGTFKMGCFDIKVPLEPGKPAQQTVVIESSEFVPEKNGAVLQKKGKASKHDKAQHARLV
jgi:hypothetical protein